MRQQYFLLVLMIMTASAVAADGTKSKGDLPATYCAYDIGQLPGLPPGESSLDVRAINNRNQIVGFTSVAGFAGVHSERLPGGAGASFAFLGFFFSRSRLSRFPRLPMSASCDKASIARQF